MVRDIGHVDVTFAVACYSVRFGKLTDSAAETAEHTQEDTCPGKLLNAVIIGVRHEDVSKIVHGDAPREIELSATDAFASLEHCHRRNLENEGLEFVRIRAFQILGWRVRNLVDDKRVVFVLLIFPNLLKIEGVEFLVRPFDEFVITPQ